MNKYIELKNTIKKSYNDFMDNVKNKPLNHEQKLILLECLHDGNIDNIYNVLFSYNNKIGHGMIQKFVKINTICFNDCRNEMQKNF